MISKIIQKNKKDKYKVVIGIFKNKKSYLKKSSICRLF